MIDLGYQIPLIGQYIMYALGGILILTGVIFAIVNIIRSRKIDEFEEKKNKNETKPRRKRSDKY
jgi:cbb3-type cytochrome oxidase subunit 1